MTAGWLAMLVASLTKKPMVRRCWLCGRTLDQPHDPTTRNCGGDCLRCMAEAGDPDCIAEMERISKEKP